MPLWPKTGFEKGKTPEPEAQALRTRTFLAAKGAIQFQGNSYLDSFDSADSNYSTDGNYDPAKRKDTAMALTNSKASGAVRLASAKIYGSATTGPGGSVTIAGGTIGDAAWVAGQVGAGCLVLVTQGI